MESGKIPSEKREREREKKEKYFLFEIDRIISKSISQ